MRIFILILLSIVVNTVHAQTLGGNATYPFLKFSYNPQLSAAGGVNVSLENNDIGFSLNNPALLREQLNKQLGIHFTEFSGIHAFHLAGAFHLAKYKTTAGASITFLDYGNLQQTDASGNIEGTFRPKDYVVQVSAARRYLQRWQYGFSLKFIQSAYAQYRSSGVAVDAGIIFTDTGRLFSIGLLAKNMGAQITSYAQREDLPFDLQLGVTKKLEKAPIAFSFTLQQLHRFDLLYHDSTFNQENNFSTNRSFIHKAFIHVIAATHIYLGKHLQATLGYNRLRRAELNLGLAGNGLTGFSAGFSAQFEKFHFSYARSTYQRGIAYNQFGINLMMDKLLGMGTL